MTCEEFKKNIADMFDKDIELQALKAYERHIESCPDCREVYNEYKQVIDLLQPHHYCATSRKPGNPRRVYRWFVAASVAVAFVIGAVTGANHFFISDATAADGSTNVYERSAITLRNVGNFSITVFARTLEDDNFATEADFTRATILSLRQNGKQLWRIDRADGLSIVCDGKQQYMFGKDNQGYRGDITTNFAEVYSMLLRPEELMDNQRRIVTTVKKAKRSSYKSGGLLVRTLTCDADQKGVPFVNIGGKSSQGGTVTFECSFTQNDGLLQGLRIWYEGKGEKTLLLYTSSIRYNIALERATSWLCQQTRR